MKTVSRKKFSAEFKAKVVIMKYCIAERRLMVVKDDQFSITDQCIMLNIQRSGFYYKPQGESDLNLELMRLIDSYLSAYWCSESLCLFVSN